MAKYYGCGFVAPDLLEGMCVLDLGCGAGFPGIPLKIASPSLEVVLCDSNRKKIDFCDAVIRELKLSSIKTEHGRAEDAKTHSKCGVFDIVISRATFKAADFLEIALPYLNRGGIAMLMKGPEWENEPLPKGTAVFYRFSYFLRENMGERHILAFQKAN